jgi:hypothetical protein
MTRQVRVEHPSRLLSNLGSPGPSRIGAQATFPCMNRLGSALVYSRAGGIVTNSTHLRTAVFPAESLNQLRNQRKKKNPE